MQTKRFVGTCGSFLELPYPDAPDGPTSVSLSRLLRLYPTIASDGKALSYLFDEKRVLVDNSDVLDLLKNADVDALKNLLECEEAL